MIDTTSCGCSCSWCVLLNRSRLWPNHHPILYFFKEHLERARLLYPRVVEWTLSRATCQQLPIQFLQHQWKMADDGTQQWKPNGCLHKKPNAACHLPRSSQPVGIGKMVETCWNHLLTLCWTTIEPVVDLGWLSWHFYVHDDISCTSETCFNHLAVILCDIRQSHQYISSHICSLRFCTRYLYWRVSTFECFQWWGSCWSVSVVSNQWTGNVTWSSFLKQTKSSMFSSLCSQQPSYSILFPQDSINISTACARCTTLFLNQRLQEAASHLKVSLANQCALSGFIDFLPHLDASLKDM